MMATTTREKLNRGEFEDADNGYELKRTENAAKVQKQSKGKSPD